MRSDSSMTDRSFRVDELYSGIAELAVTVSSVFPSSEILRATGTGETKSVCCDFRPCAAYLSGAAFHAA